MNKVIHTKWGKAKLYTENGNDGYYVIISKKEGYGGKRLHRLIYENVHGEIPKGYVIHHKNGDKTDNCILNLEALPASEHSSIHNAGQNNHWYGVTGEDNFNYGRKHSINSKIKISNAKNVTGFYRVSKLKNNKVKQGFSYAYYYYDENNVRKAIGSIDITKLRDKVVDKGLPWIVTDEEKTKKILSSIR